MDDGTDTDTWIALGHTETVRTILTSIGVAAPNDTQALARACRRAEDEPNRRSGPAGERAGIPTTGPQARARAELPARLRVLEFRSAAGRASA